MTPEDIKAWLKRIGKTRAWLAEQCGIGKRSLDNWLSASKSIPHAQLRLIEHLMAKEQAHITPSIDLSCVESVSFVLTSQEAARLRRALEATNMSMQDYLRQAVNERTAQILADQETSKNASIKPNVASAC